MTTNGTPTRFCQSALTATATKLYTAANDGKSIVLDIMCANTDSNQRTLHLYIGATNDTKCLIHNAKISANEYLHLGKVYQVINSGESIYANGDNTGLVLTISGLERM